MKHERIEVNPDVMLGKPVVKGTRLTVEHIMGEIEQGMSVADILEAHPRLTEADIVAAREFAEKYLTRSAAQ
jgi:uncharacterized protein (DUF433 family)